MLLRRHPPEAVKHAAAQAGWPAAGSPILVAVSGGLDSTTLLALLAGIDRHPLHVAHVDHGMRPDSAADARHVEALASSMGRPCTVLHLTSPPRGETAAREARYEALSKLASTMGISAIALGHHADDQAETLLLRMVRGTAPDGLAGMGIVGEGPGGVRLLRPLLPCTRSALASWYRDQGLPPPLEDPTNFDPGHTPRNFIRLQLAPLLGQLQPRWVEAFGRLADRAREDREALAAWAETAYVDLCVDGSRAPVAAGLAGLPPAVQRRVLQRWQPEWDTARTEQVIGWLAAGSPGHLHLKGGVLAVRDGRLALMASSAETLVPCRLCLTPTPGGPSMPEGHSPPDLRVC